MPTDDFSLSWRLAVRAEVQSIVDLLRDDDLGKARERVDLTPYLQAFDRMLTSPGNDLIVGVRDCTVLATYQITFTDGLSLVAARRAQIEGVRVTRHLRGQGVGAALMADAEARALAVGCRLMQFTTNASRTRAHAFYRRCGYEPSHVGFKKFLD